MRRQRLIEKQTKSAGEEREEIDEGMERLMGSRGGARESGWTGEKMRDEGYQKHWIGSVSP